VVLPARDHDHIWCFTDQVKFTCALVQGLDEAIKKVKLLGEHEEESSQKITELEALCKKLSEDTQKLEEEKATLEGMVESCDELITEITRETRLDRIGEDAKDEEEDEDADDREDAAAPSIPLPLLPCLRRSSRKEALRRWFLNKNPMWCMKSSWQVRCRSPISTTHSRGIIRRAHPE
jgi:predicted RNase H-like nuclease (RuvC/YqgF family)